MSDMQEIIRSKERPFAECSIEEKIERLREEIIEFRQWLSSISTTFYHVGRQFESHRDSQDGGAVVPVTTDKYAGGSTMEARSRDRLS